jgi:hypothetical protein
LHSSDGLPYQQCLLVGRDDHRSDGEYKEKDAENNRNPKEGFLNATPGGKNGPRIPACHIAQAGALTLQDNTNHQGN